jgi:hypothetical protein
VVEGLRFQCANLTSFTILYNDYTAYKENRISYLSDLNTDIDNLTTNLSILNSDINKNFVDNSSLSTLSIAFDDQFTLITTCIDDKLLEQHDYTDQEIEA